MLIAVRQGKEEISVLQARSASSPYTSVAVLVGGVILSSAQSCCSPVFQDTSGSCACRCSSLTCLQSSSGGHSLSPSGPDELSEWDNGALLVWELGAEGWLVTEPAVSRQPRLCKRGQSCELSAVPL